MNDVPDRPVSVRSLEALFRRPGVGGRSLKPNPQALAKLAEQIEGVRKSFPLAVAMNASDNRRRRFAEALSALAKELPAVLRESQELCADFMAFNKSVPAKFDNELRSLNALSASVAMVTQVMKAEEEQAPLPPLDPPTRKRWHSVYWALEDFFREAMRSTNDREPGFAREGPVVKFLVAIIPAVTGENPDANAVYDYRQRRARR